MAFLLKLSPYGKGDEVFYDVRVDLDSARESAVVEVMKQMNLKPQVQTISNQPEGIKRIRYEIRISGEEALVDLYERLIALEEVHTARIARALREQEL